MVSVSAPDPHPTSIHVASDRGSIHVTKRSATGRLHLPM
jgi:hypothetical protein